MKTISQSKLLKTLLFFITAISLGTVSVYAQGTGINTAANPTAAAGANLLSLVDLMQVLVTRIIPLLIGATVVAFFIMMVMHMFGDGKDKEKMWHYMMYAVVVLFVEVSIWGLVAFLGSATGIKQGGQIAIPEIPTGVRTYDPSRCTVQNIGGVSRQCCKDANNNYVCQ